METPPPPPTDYEDPNPLPDVVSSCWPMAPNLNLHKSV